jgi:transposase InsO family protein
MLLRLAYLGVTNAFALLRLLPGSDRDKDAEILALRHQLAVLQRQLGEQRVRFDPAHRAWLAALLHPLPIPILHRLRLLVRPDTILRWHRPACPPPRGSIASPTPGPAPHCPLDPRPGVTPRGRESVVGIPAGARGTADPRVKVAASTVWEILRAAGVDPALERTATTWAQFLRSQAEVLLAVDFIETITLTGTRMYVLAVIEHASRRIRILGATAHPTAAWVTQTARNLVMDLEDTRCRVNHLIRDRDGKYPALFDAVLADAGITVVLSGVRMPRMNAVMERWVRTCRRELLDRTLIFNQRHLLHALREYEVFYNGHRPHQGIANARPLAPLPAPITDPHRLAHLNIHRHEPPRGHPPRVRACRLTCPDGILGRYSAVDTSLVRRRMVIRTPEDPAFPAPPVTSRGGPSAAVACSPDELRVIDAVLGHRQQDRPTALARAVTGGTAPGGSPQASHLSSR